MTAQPIPPREPRELSAAELVTITVALEHCRRQEERGAEVILYRLPKCPNCATPPDSVITDEPHRAHWVRFRPCGHEFFSSGERAYEAVERALAIVDREENRPVGEHLTADQLDVRDAEVELLRAQVAAARAFAVEMRGYCTPHGISALYADRLDERLDQAGEVDR